MNKVINLLLFKCAPVLLVKCAPVLLVKCAPVLLVKGIVMTHNNRDVYQSDIDHHRTRWSVFLKHFK